MKKQKPEPWSGAGVRVDLRNPQPDDFRRIEGHVEKMPDLQDRLEWLDRLITEILYQVPRVRWDMPEFSGSYNARELFKDCDRLRTKWKTIFDAEARKKADPKGKPEFTTAQSCLVIHYLLHAAGHTKRDKAVENLIVSLTGWDGDNVRKRLVDMLSRKAQKAKDLRVLKPYFKALGLSEVVGLIDVELANGKEDDDDDDFS